MNLRDYQMWLRAHGAVRRKDGRPLDTDGIPGGDTRAAPFTVFANKRAPAVTDEQIEAFAARLGGTAKQVRAIATVESAGGGFFDDGMPKALYERHYFWKRVRIKIPLLSDPAPGGYTIDADNDGLNDSWEKIADAAMRNPIAAYESASFGKFQVMGAWAVKLGYPNAIEMAYSMSRTEAAHYEAMVRYIERFGLVEAFRSLSSDPVHCVAFACGYNGPGQKGYDIKLARAMR